MFGGIDPTEVAAANAVAVIGLGRFGSALALELMDNGTEVLGIDPNEEVVQAHNARLTHVVKADATKEEVLRQLTVHEFDRVVVAIGSHLEASILTTSLLLRFGIPHIWVKADSAAHGAILDQLGVPHVVYAEHEMGRRVAHLVRGRMQDYIEIDDDFALVKTNPPRSIVGISLGKTSLRHEHGVTIVAVKPLALPWTYATAETILTSDDLILVAGPAARAEAFSQLR
ncbi:potassium channel family protein [Tessaracoccus caeni]|uniref:potassium channel family protein n=1 Tax=Tessaracoccus caeni TaxID=3031239 RepID=UPI0023DC73B9|nr:TrkA family potassium uptake protein [Tessaracoccus caeni]MDF1488595.1 TrkA family potassium uptake protein [Tessaracoccus caeni]